MEDQYQALYTTFRWWVPQRFNIAEACCRRWTATSADARRIALYAEDASGRREVWTFARLQEYANRLANGLRRMGVQRGDRVAIVLPQRPESLVAHIAVYQLGAVTVPLSTQLASEVVEQRLRDSEARIVLVDEAAAASVLPAAERCPLLRQAIGIDLDDERTLAWRTLIARQESAFDMHPTTCNDPAVLLYNSGTTGPAKGILLAHGALIGSLPGFVASQNWFPERTDVLWTSSEWGTGHGLFGALLPALYFGQPLVASRHALDPAHTLELLERYRVTNLSMHPSALRTLLKGVPHAKARYDLALRAIALGGAYVGKALFARCSNELGVVPNETFSQAEVNTVIGQSHEKWPPRPGSMGRPYPGHQVALVTPQGYAVAPGAVGEIVVNRYDGQGHADPALFLGYWRNEETGRPNGGPWHHTGDLARVDADGYFWYAGRVEDVFGVDRHHVVVPDEVETLLMDYPGIDAAAVIAQPAAGGGIRIKAYVTLAASLSHAQVAPADSAARTGADPIESQPTGLDTPSSDTGPSPASSTPSTCDHSGLIAVLQAHVREHLPAHMVPDDIEVIDALPMTVTGNVRRWALRAREEERARKRLPAPAQPVPAR